MPAGPAGFAPAGGAPGVVAGVTGGVIGALFSGAPGVVVPGGVVGPVVPGFAVPGFAFPSGIVAAASTPCTEYRLAPKGAGSAIEQTVLKIMWLGDAMGKMARSQCFIS